LLVNGEPRWEREARPGEVVRLWLTNVSNTRTWNLSLPGARLKVVASDLGRFEREEWVDNVVIAPAERYVVDARFGEVGTVPLLNRVQVLDHVGGRILGAEDTLGTFTVAGPPITPDLSASFAELRRPAGAVEDAASLRATLARPPDRELVLTLATDSLPFVLQRMFRLDTSYVHPVEWEGTMPLMDLIPTTDEVHWILRDPATGAENEDIEWHQRVGDRVRLRLRNDRSVLHPMAHPIHVHGQRFVVLARNGVPVDNLVWKDTALVPVGGTVDLLVEFTNPGKWMIHCHIAEHLSAGMAMVVVVE
jgi:FtsP/CotA-like multicopper oxidase with cupredoxin domain